MSLAAPTALNTHYEWRTSLTLTDPATRETQMQSIVDEWLESLTAHITTPMGPAQREDYLRMQARIPYASVRNTVLLTAQAPQATELRTYDGWTSPPGGAHEAAFRDTSALWLWDPIIDRECPACGGGLFEHDTADDSVSCTDVPPARWDYNVITASPTPLFSRQQLSDPSNTAANTPVHIRPPAVGADEHRPDLSEDADYTPDPGRLPAFQNAAAVQHALPSMAAELPVRFTRVPKEDWQLYSYASIGSRDTYTLHPTVKAVDAAPAAEQVPAVLEAFAEAILMPDVSAGATYRKRRVEVAAATYAACLTLGHESRFTLDVPSPISEFDRWGHDDAATVRQRLTRIRHAVCRLIQAAVLAT